MSGRFSKSEIDRLGERIRAARTLSADDLEMLQAFRLERREHLEEVMRDLRGLGWRPTGRVKTRNTLVEKLHRDSKLSLSRMQDVVGSRIVVEGGRQEQDAVVAALVARYPDSRTVDRREWPSGGYRAVHIVVRHRGWPLEIQVRTPLQDAWAQVFEQFADVFGRELRYGGVPTVGGTGPYGSVLRWAARHQTRELLRLSEAIDRGERAGLSVTQAAALRERLHRRHEAIVRLRRREERQR